LAVTRCINEIKGAQISINLWTTPQSNHHIHEQRILFVVYFFVDNDDNIIYERWLELEMRLYGLRGFHYFWWLNLVMETMGYERK
jgi:hypothetical protein